VVGFTLQGLIKEYNNCNSSNGNITLKIAIFVRIVLNFSSTIPPDVEIQNLIRIAFFISQNVPFMISSIK